MKIGIIGTSKAKNKDLIKKVAKIIAATSNPVVLTPDKGSTSEFFAKEYLKEGGRKIFIIAPLNDTEFGYSWLNLKLGEKINCNTWRNQPEKLNEECDALVSLGYSVGGLIEICYSKWFKKKPVYILKELIKNKLPKELEKDLDLRYISLKKLKNELQNK